jgi:RNA polymerase sigma-70 factor, ECF subfamily
MHERVRSAICDSATGDPNMCAGSRRDPRGSLTPVSFAALYADAFPALCCIAAGVLGERTGADDVVQEAAVSALQKLDQFASDSNFIAWMGQFVRFGALNTVRQRVRRTTKASDPALMDAAFAAPMASSEPVLDAHGELTRDQASFDDDVVRALRTLDPTARTCLLLRAVLDMSYHEIAAALSIPEGTAMSHVHRARAAIRTKLADAQSGTEGGSRGK